MEGRSNRKSHPAGNGEIDVEDVNRLMQEMDSNMMSLNDVVQTLFPPQLGGEPPTQDFQEIWNTENGKKLDLAHRIFEYIQENPGRSKNAILMQFKAEGFSPSKILEAYHILIYDKKIIMKMNVGTKSAPRYAHFSSPPFFVKPERDVLYEVLGPL